MRKRFKRTVLVAAMAIVAPVAAIVGSVTAAYATGPSLSLSVPPFSGTGPWIATGSGLSHGESNVDLWVMDVTEPVRIACRGGFPCGWSVVEHQGGLHTSSTKCSKMFCWLGGWFAANAAQAWWPPSEAVNMVFGFWYPVNPLSCGRVYEPVLRDAHDGIVFGTKLVMPSCPPPPGLPR